MTAQCFWNIIDSARENKQGDLDAIYDALLERLCDLPLPKLMKWELIFEEYRDIARKNKIWAAAHLVNDGCTSAGFGFFVGWLIAQGKETFFAVLRDPETLADLQVVWEDHAVFEEMLHISKSAFFQRRGMTLWDTALYYRELRKRDLLPEEKRGIRAEVVLAQDIDRPWKEEELGEWMPRLVKKFGQYVG